MRTGRVRIAERSTKDTLSIEEMPGKESVHGTQRALIVEERSASPKSANTLNTIDTSSVKWKKKKDNYSKVHE